MEEQHKGTFHYPSRVNYFMDPQRVIKHYTGCKLNQKHSQVLGYGLAEMWCYCTSNTSLEHAHSSIVDARAQRDSMIDSVGEQGALIESYESDQKSFKKSLRLTARVAREKIGSKTRRLLRRDKKKSS